MSNILITSAGRRVSLVRAFKKELIKCIPKGKVYITDLAPNLSAAAQVADHAFATPLVNSKDYIDILLDICLKHNINLIVPTIDDDLLILSKYKSLFSEKRINVIVSDEEFVNVCSHKVKTHQLFKSLNIDVAKLYKKDNYKIPLYIKPINGSSSVNNFTITTNDQISKHHLETDSLQFFEYLDHDIYDEYTCDLYYDRKGHLKCGVPRLRIEIRAGEVSKSVTKNQAVKNFIDNHLSKLEGASGCITVQLFYDSHNNIFKGIEINPRFGGGFPLSYLAGANYPKWIIQEYIFNKEMKYYDGWKSNLLMLRYDDEILVHEFDE
ncbi:ATP-grasp domain-containing protein [uncultured Algibacter sp.]|uniref:ATP-grasp domain-containing protein n=1 Tax=uncultured Algibacter sp. TaxID=298659 RepID=UPI002618FF50|nr:ATP-grasp domain-containing protein [uncultured Algibacter sp.]